MLSIKKILSEKEKIVEGLQKKFFTNLNIIHFIEESYNQRKDLQLKYENILREINVQSKNIGILIKEKKTDEAENQKIVVYQLKQKSKDLNEKITLIDEEIEKLLIQIPNIPHTSVPIGKTIESNEIVKEENSLSMQDSNKTYIPHWEITDKHNLIDFENGAKMSGSGFPIYKQSIAKLIRSIVSYCLDKNIEAGYQEYATPLLVNEQTAFGTGQIPDKENQMYVVELDKLFLIPTSEVTLTNIYSNVVIPQTTLPIKMTAHTACFRREAGSYGKDVRGLNRLHQFDKVEIVQIVDPKISYTALDEMVAHIEKLIVNLELPYRILKLCTGDMSFASALTFDFEIFALGQKKWIECSSVSNFEEFQTNRMKIRIHQENSQNILAHSLNGSSLAIPRIIAGIIENHYHGSHIAIPKALIPYFGSDKLILE